MQRKDIKSELRQLSIGLLADFNARNLGTTLCNCAKTSNVTIACSEAPFGQVSSLLINQNAEFWSSAYDAIVLWTLPENIVPTFRKALSFEQYCVDDLLGDVDSFCRLVRNIPSAVRTIIIPSWTPAFAERAWSGLDFVSGIGHQGALMRMNLRLVETLLADPRVIILDSSKWFIAVGKEAYSPKLWYLSKTPFGADVFREASKDVLAALEGVRGRSKKIVIVDLDNTLWGGIVGEVGWPRLRLGGHDALGEAYADFQRVLKRLTNRGILLAIASKNEESTALNAIRENPEMILGMGDFVAWRINWHDKAENIIDLLSEVNLGVDSAVFIDDSPLERARVRQALPEVLVPELPQDATQLPALLRSLRCFDRPAITDEDRSRTRMYVADRDRTALRREMTSIEEWLYSLDLCISVESLDERNLQRAAQLMNKTNQMNLTTRRMAPPELLEWARVPANTVLVFRVYDRFGDYGVCALASISYSNGAAELVDFLLSCRVMGRGVEEAVLATVMRHAMEAGCRELVANYAPTPRNLPCKNWLSSLGCASVKDDIFIFGDLCALKCPKHVRMSSCEADEKALV